MQINNKLRNILPKVQKPARYTGGEYGQIIKDPAACDIRIAFCFPDTYEIGMSNLGMRILYGLWNDMPGVWCERVFAPWGDMEDKMREAGIELFALESHDPVKDFDIVAFSLGYEMAFSTVLDMLDLAGIPIRSSERDSLRPLVIAGGSSCYNPEPIADFIDLFIIGEGEEVNPEITELYRTAKKENWKKDEFLCRAAQIKGIYVPSLYSVEYNDDGTVRAITHEAGAPAQVDKRIILDLDEAYMPVKTIVPSTSIVHDRVVLELFRGCIRGCRFCQAGFIYRPVRARSKDLLIEAGKKAIADSGYDEMTLSSLSTSDYKQLEGLCDGLLEWCEPRKVSLSLPSLRADNFSMSITERVQKVRKSGLTFAPEAGSQRLRDTINKNVTEEDILNTCRTAFESGWSSVKLYFMLGLPTETDEDVLAIAELVSKVVYVWRAHATNKARGFHITVSTSCFIPKPHTPFQWERQISMDEYMARVALLRGALRSKSVSYNWHDADTSRIEAVLSRGDRRLGAVIESVFRKGGKLEAWGEYFSYARWEEAFAETGLDMDFYASRERKKDEILPWSVISDGVDVDFLWSEREAAYRGVITPDCRHGCAGCGASSMLKGGVCDA